MLPILKQFGIIITLSFIGEVLHSILPLPVPASIYGIILLFICLRSHLLHVIQIRETIYFLIEIMPILSGRLWLFGAPGIPDAALPERTSLQRGAKELLLQGKPLGSGLGLLKL